MVAAFTTGGGAPRGFPHLYDIASAPLFRCDRTGRTSRDPLSLLEGVPKFSLEKLAVNFDNPFLEAEFPPCCPWDGISRVDTVVTPPPRGTSAPDDLREAFLRAIEHSIGDSEVVAVMYSGGLDSTSVLVNAAELCAAQGRRLLAVVWNLDDQFGVPTGQLAHRQLKAMRTACELRILPVAWRDLPEPAWSPAGVRIDYYTRLHQAMIELAMGEGAEVLLTGVGGDEVLAAWQFMTPDLVAARRWRDLRGYHRGFAMGDGIAERTGELAAVCARALPARRSFDLYAAFACTRLFRPLARPVLADQYLAPVRAAAGRWLRDRCEQFVRLRQSWSDASLWDSIYPLAHAAHPAGVPIREASPFLEPSFIEFALGLPVADRFRFSAAPPYHWYKSLHFRLLPPQYLAVAPRYKQSYSHIFRQYQLDVLPDGDLACVELGLLRPLDKRDIERTHPRLPAAVRNVEHWIRGALAFGARPC